VYIFTIFFLMIIWKVRTANTVILDINRRIDTSLLFTLFSEN